MNKLRLRVATLLRRRKLEKDLDDELAFHLAMRSEASSPRPFGNVTRVKEDCREAWSLGLLEQLWADLRFAARSLVKSPGFTLVGVLALAVGIGVNVTIFGFVNGIVFGPRLVANEPDRLISIWTFSDAPTTDFDAYRNRNGSVSQLATFTSTGAAPIRIEGQATPIDVVPITLVTGNLFETFGVNAALGRMISSEDAQPGAPRVAMLSNLAWRRYFGADPGVIGRSIVLPPGIFTIVGVTQEGVNRTLESNGPTVLFLVPWTTPALPYKSFGRLKRNVSIAQAQADFSRIAAQLAAEDHKFRSVLVQAADELHPQSREDLWNATVLFSSITGLVLWIACANLSILLLARTAARNNEITVRLALGAGRWRVIRQLLTENLLIALLGGIGALTVALISGRVLTDLMSRLAPPDVSPQSMLSFDLDWRVFIFAIGMSVVACLLFGLSPLLQSVRKDIATGLRRSTSSGATRIRSGLIIGAQVMFSTTLLATTAVLVRSVDSTETMISGFSSNRVVTGTLWFSSGSLPRDEEAIASVHRLLERIQSHPAIISVSFGDFLPLPTGTETGFVAPPATDTFRDANAIPADGNNVRIPISASSITPNTFTTLGMTILNGRDFAFSDRANSNPVGIINEAMAGRVWPGENPVGKWLLDGNGSRFQIVGLVRNAHYGLVEKEPQPFVYRPFAQKPGRARTILIKTAGNSAEVISNLNSWVSETGSDAVFRVQTLNDQIALTLLPNRLASSATGILGSLALALGIVGIYGTMALVVRQRRREMGIRIALGATPQLVVGHVTRRAMLWTAFGIVTGLGGAFAAVRWLQSAFYGIRSFDLVAFFVPAIVLALTAGLASLIPAARAARLDPLTTIRED